MILSFGVEEKIKRQKDGKMSTSQTSLEEKCNSEKSYNWPPLIEGERSLYNAHLLRIEALNQVPIRLWEECVEQANLPEQLTRQDREFLQSYDGTSEEVFRTLVITTKNISASLDEKKSLIDCIREKDIMFPLKLKDKIIELIQSWAYARGVCLTTVTIQGEIKVYDNLIWVNLPVTEREKLKNASYQQITLIPSGKIIKDSSVRIISGSISTSSTGVYFYETPRMN